MTKKNNQNNQSGQLARQSQNQKNSNKKSNNQNRGNNTLGQPSLAAPVAYSSSTMNQPPRINTGSKSSRIIHRELVATISGNTTFGSSSFALNPGLVLSFPWLSTVAPSYEQYHFRRLRFHYVTRSATSYVGSVLLAPEYDALDQAPTTEVNMAMMAGAKEDVPWRDQVIDFNVADMFPLGPRKFIRTGALSTSADLKTYDVGQLFVGLAGCADTSAIGKLWVEYDVELYIPQNPNAIQSVGVGASAILTLTANNTLASGVAEIVPFGTVSYNSIGGTNTTGSYVLPLGEYLVSASIAMSSSAVAGIAPAFLIELRKDGAALPVVINMTKSGGSVNVDNVDCLSLIGYINSTGANAVSVWSTATAAGSTLINLANNCQMSIVRIA
jgi:hypothetical protein